MDHWFSELAEHMGPAYDRYSFTKGTAQEVEALVDLLDVSAGQRILDVGCGPGRHSKRLAALGFEVVGIDISPRFVALARENAGPNETYLLGDARSLSFDAEFDAVISLCQGAFGLTGGPDAEETLPDRELDESIMVGIAAALRPGSRAAVSAFSAYFQLRHGNQLDLFDARLGVNHEQTEVRNVAGSTLPAELWTTCFTPRELRLLARIVGLRPLAVHSVTPGGYGPYPAETDQPEFLLVAERSADDRR